MEQHQLHQLCAAKLATQEDNNIFVDGHLMNLKEVLRVKRTNNIINHELGLYRAYFGVDTPTAYYDALKETTSWLQSRMPSGTLEEVVRLTYSNHSSSFPHQHLGRVMLDESYLGLFGNTEHQQQSISSRHEGSLSTKQFLTVNLFGKLVDAPLGDMLLLLTELLTCVLLTRAITMETLVAELGLVVHETHETRNNVITMEGFR